MEDFLGMTNVADIQEVGGKCFEDELYQAANFSSISNWAWLATTLIYLGENQAAVESARMAGNTVSFFILSGSKSLTYIQGLETGSCRLY
jgi:clathrin heavy chain